MIRRARGRDCWTIQSGTRFSPSRPCARRCAPCSASRLRRALTAALPRASPAAGQSAREKLRSIMNGITLYITDVDAESGFRLATIDEIMTGARQALALRIRRGTDLSSPQRARDYLMTRLAEREHEVFTVIYLDNRHRLIACQELFRGTIDGASVHPREVVKEALRHNAAALILAHNHPSFVSEPSQADELVTRRLREALQLVDIRVLDHLIVAGGETL